MPRFFVAGANIFGGVAYIGAEDADHFKALRISNGEMITVCDGNGSDYSCRVTNVTRDGAEAEIISKTPSASEPTVDCTVFAALSKGDKLDTVVQKSVELGATKIVVFPSKRCVVKLDNAQSAKKLARLCRIAASAAEQSERGMIPTVEAASSFETAVKLAASAELPIFCYEDEHTLGIKTVFEEHKTANTVSVFTGPEGGFDPEEVILAKEAGMISVSLGPRILRCETAPLCPLTDVMLFTDHRRYRFKKGVFDMNSVKLTADGVTIRGGVPVQTDIKDAAAREKTIAYSVLRAHDKGDGGKKMRISFDAMVSHDITYVGIIQTARASGMKEFPIPYALTNCHNSLCAVGGTINQDDHAFGLSAAKKYGGIFVPANQAVIHQYAREALTGCGRMILGSDSHTRYGCYGTLGVGEGGGELAKQLLNNTWDIDAPEVILVWVKGKVPHGIGPHDVAIALVGATFGSGFVKNKVLEFAGPGIGALSTDFRIGVDVMTTETSCLTSVWETDDKVRAYYENHGRPEAYRKLSVSEGAYYDGMVEIDLDKMESMIALPFHPSKAYTIHELQSSPEKIFDEINASCNRELGGKVELDLRKSIGEDGKIRCEQGVIVGCSGGMYENVMAAASIMDGRSVGNGYFEMSVYPSSVPISIALMRSGALEKLMRSGALIKSAFCGPCFGAGDTPANNTLSVRHATRNFANREGSKPANGQIAAVALMDARSIAATAANGGVLTAATDIEYEEPVCEYVFDASSYSERVYNGFGHPIPETELRFGPNITDWPKMSRLNDDLLLRLCAVIRDDVTTTDELIPSGETSSYRSNPIALSEFALSRRCPEYVGKSKKVRDLENARVSGGDIGEAQAALDAVGGDVKKTTVGSCVFAKKPGDGSAREQAASCQKVLGGFGNIAYEYATKRYRSNLINWGIVPFTLDKSDGFEYEEGDWVYVPGIRDAILSGTETVTGTVISGGKTHEITLHCAGLTDDERLILTEGCLMNYYAAGYGAK